MRNVAVMLTVAVLITLLMLTGDRIRSRSDYDRATYMAALKALNPPLVSAVSSDESLANTEAWVARAGEWLDTQVLPDDQRAAMDKVIRSVAEDVVHARKARAIHLPSPPLRGPQ